MGVLADLRAARGHSVWQTPLQPTVAMIRLDLFASLTALAPYAVAAAAVALAAFLVQNDLHRVQEDGLLVLGEPFAVPLYSGLILISVYLAVSAATAVGREREHGAVELLCFGPVNSFSYLLAQLCSHVLQYVVLLILLVGSFGLLAIATGLHLRSLTILATVLSLGPAAAATTLGLLVAALVRRVRPATFGVLGLAVGAVGLQVAQDVLARLPAPEFHVNPVLVLRWATFAVSTVTQWLLPFGYVDREISTMLRGDLAGALGTAVAASVYAVVVLFLAAAGLERTGIRK